MIDKNIPKTSPELIFKLRESAFANDLLMFLSEGKCYSTSEMKKILDETGFKDIQYRPTILNRSIITGIKPE